MATLRISPGSAADEAFTLGVWTATLVVLAGVGFLLWADVLTLLDAAFALLLGLPVYLLVVSSLLSVWLGYGRDALDRRLVVPDATRD